jgi:hypothetical protein
MLFAGLHTTTIVTEALDLRRPEQFKKIKLGMTLEM